MAKIDNVEVGKFYVCTLETAKCYGLTKGKIYKSVFKEGIGITILNDYSTPLAINGFKDCFRPATEEEILAEQKLVEGVTNEPTQSEVTKESGQLTEFEKELATLLGHYYICKSDPDTDFTDIEFAKEYSQDLLSIARKQAASEIDVDAMVKIKVDKLITQVPSFVSDVNATLRAAGFAALYRQGIEDTLKVIRKGE